MKTDMKLGTWNVRTLRRAGSQRPIDEALAALQLDIVALQEMRWLGSGSQNRRGSSYDIYYSCHDRDHMLGTGFVVGLRLKPAIIDFRPVNESYVKPGPGRRVPTRTSPNIYTRLPLRDFTPNSYDSILSTSQTTSCSSSSNGGHATSQIYTDKC
ncbi:uncharacterized protein LOC128274573 [Anopheles cruzii]|uniref:uncharacterized protein LOC128274573 n=1 Tax=Anopheles cruzii TaxID=68878 RepID=UPI0022EC7947|nr:uncharacterized protein LOC128274573 [Anopheles cruzii]